MQGAIAAIVVTAGLLAGLGVVNPAPAQADVFTGTWRRQNPVTFQYPSNWKCAGSTMASDGRSVAQNCLVRATASPNWAQTVLVIRNLTSSNLPTDALVSFSKGGTEFFDYWRCPPSSLGPHGLSVCYSATKYAPYQIMTFAQWRYGYEDAKGYSEYW